MTDKPFTEYYRDKIEEKKAGKIFTCFIFLVIIVFGMLFAINYDFNQKYTYVSINGMSMQPTLNPDPYIDGISQQAIQDGVYIRNTQDVDYGEIIILENVIKDKTIIKRVLALGGDYISIVKVEDDGASEFRILRMKDGSNQIEIIEEDYILSYRSWVNMYYNEDLTTPQDPQTDVVYEPAFYSKFDGDGYESRIVTVSGLGGQDVKMYKVPENNVFFLGDNRAYSQDSRALGTTTTENIMGSVVKIVRNGADYEGNVWWQFNRFKGYISVIWDNILRFFGADI